MHLAGCVPRGTATETGGDVNLDRAIQEANMRVQSLINERHDRLQIRNRFTFEHARRSMAQRLRNDGREKRHGKDERAHRG